MAAEVDHLLTLARSDTDAGRWLACAIRDWCDGKSWTTATGIQPSQVSRAIRDQHLKAASAMLGGDPVELHRAVMRFESALWPRWKRQGHPTGRATPLNRELFHARQSAPLPSSVKQYRRILRDT